MRRTETNTRPPTFSSLVRIVVTWALANSVPFGPTVVGDDLSQCPGQPQPPVDLAEQQAPGVTGDGPTAEIGDDILAFEPRKMDGVRVTLCHHGIASLRSSVCSVYASIDERNGNPVLFFLAGL